VIAPRPSFRPTAHRVVIAANPYAGSRSRVAEIGAIADSLEDHELEVEILTDLDLIARRAEAYYEGGGLRALVAAGGDGTVATLANLTSPEVPLAIIPFGTENLLAKHLGLTSDPAAMTRLLTTGVPMRFDAGRANGRLFALMLGCGFDAEVVRRFHRERSGNISHFDYAKPILDSMRSYRYPEIRVSVEEQLAESNGPGARQSQWHTISARWAFVANLPEYARGLRIVPEARGRDGLLDVCTFRRGTVLRGLWYLSRIACGWHRRMSDRTLAQCRRLRLEADEAVPYQMDGDPGGFLPVEIEVLPERLKLLVPVKWASEYRDT